MTIEFDDEALVAYLDGELTEDERKQIDAQLAAQPQLRKRLSDLRATWDILECLPSEPPSPRFAETTLEMAALASNSKQPLSTSNWIIKNIGRVLLIAFPLFFVAGFAMSRVMHNRVEKQLLRDLPILVDWRSLSNVDSIEWLNVLIDQPDLVRAYQDDELGLVGDGDVPADLNERREWLNQLSDSDRGRLNVNLTEFRQREPARQSELRNVIQAIYENPAKKQGYLMAARAYELLLQEQSMTERAALYDLPLEDRRRELGHLISVKLSKLYAKSIPSNDAEAIRSWADEMTSKYLIGRNADALQSVYFELVVNYATSEISLEDFEILGSRLSPEAQRILAGLNSSDTYVDSIVDWIAALAGPSDPSTDRLSADRLKELYLNLPGTQQDKIDLLQPEQAKAAIRKIAKPRSTLQSSPPS